MKEKVVVITLFLFSQHFSLAQSNTENLISGGKVLVELITLLSRKTNPGLGLSDKQRTGDSCAIKNKADVCFRNSVKRSLTISVFRRNDSTYDAAPFTLKVIDSKKECLYELRSGIYKYRIEGESEGKLIVLSEGEFRLQPCDNMLREIKQ